MKTKLSMTTLLPIMSLSLFACQGGGSGDSNHSGKQQGVKISAKVLEKPPEESIAHHESIISAEVYADQKQSLTALDNGAYVEIKGVALDGTSSKNTVHATLLQQQHVGNNGDCFHQTTKESIATAKLSAGEHCYVTYKVSGGEVGESARGNIYLKTSTGELKSSDIKTSYHTKDDLKNPSAIRVNDDQGVFIAPGSVVKLSIKSQNKDINNLMLIIPEFLQQKIELSDKGYSLQKMLLKKGDSHVFQFKLKDKFDTPFTASQIHDLKNNDDGKAQPLIYLIAADLPQTSIGKINIVSNKKVNLTNGHISSQGDKSTILELVNADKSPITIHQINNSQHDLITQDLTLKDSCRSGLKLPQNSSCYIKLLANDQISSDPLHSKNYHNTTSVMYGDNQSIASTTDVDTLTRIDCSSSIIIHQSNTGVKEVPIRFKNNGPFVWKPSTKITDYVIGSDDAGLILPVWGNNTATSCLSGNKVAIGEDCQMMMLVSDKTSITGSKKAYIQLKSSANSNIANDTTIPLVILANKKAHLSWKLNGEEISNVHQSINLGYDDNAFFMQHFVLKNDGDIPLVINKIIGSPKLGIDSTKCLTTLSQGASCDVYITANDKINIDSPVSLEVKTQTPSENIDNISGFKLDNIIATETVYCFDKPVGSKFLAYDNKHYLVVDNDAIRDRSIKQGILNGRKPVCTSHVTSMVDLFLYDPDFNQPINNWDVSRVTNMTGMFHNARHFNQPINSWDVSRVTNMAVMFHGAENFNQPLNNWNTSKVHNMYQMFQDTYSFNQPLNNWSVTNVENMAYMFFSSAFDQDISLWNVTHVLNHDHFGDFDSWKQPEFNT